MPQTQTAAIPRHQAEEKKDNTYHVQNKQTNAQEAHRAVPSFPSEVITMLKGMKKHEDISPLKVKYKSDFDDLGWKVGLEAGDWNTI